MAAAARTLLEPYVQAIATCGASSVVMTTTIRPDAEPVHLSQQKTALHLDLAEIRRLLIRILVGSAAAAVATAVGCALVDVNIDTQKQELESRIAKIRAAAHGTTLSPLDAAQQTLHERKSVVPRVVVLDALAKSLPDHTYVN